MSDTVKNQTPLHIACILGLTEVAQALLECGADKTLTDSYGNQPFYYLSCSQEERLKNIEEVLDSVNFFFGRYFEADDAKAVCNTLVHRNKLLQSALSEVIQSHTNGFYKSPAPK